MAIRQAGGFFAACIARFLAAIFGALLSIGWAQAGVAGPSDASLDIVNGAAHDAQRRCYEFMHEDADEFVSCIDALEQQIDGRDSSSRWRRLGVRYFGWVGANNSARVALPGAERAAQRYFERYQAVRRQLDVDERRLCSAIPGDCEGRLAQIAAAQRMRSRTRER